MLAGTPITRGFIGAVVIGALSIPLAGFVYFNFLPISIAGHADRLMATAAAPPAADATHSWLWAAAAPGENIYFANRGLQRDDDLVSAWIKREFFRNLAGIDKSLIEFMQFDCSRNMNRRALSVGSPNYLAAADQPKSAAMSGWIIARRGTTDERVLLVVCESSKSAISARVVPSG